MNKFDSLVLGRDFERFLPGFRSIEYLAIIFISAFVISGHADASLMSILAGGLFAAYLIPRAFLVLAKHGLLGKNWDKDGLVNNPY